MHMIVKRLSAIQDLGSMDVLCTDKTGTLTEAKIRLERHVDATGRPSERVLELAYFNSFFETGLKSPLDEAILGHQHIEIGAWKKIDEVPFDFERRRVSVLIDNGETRWLVVKGRRGRNRRAVHALRSGRRPNYSAPWMKRRWQRFAASTARWRKKASGCWASPGGRCPWTIPMPW